ncbi:MAG TPA: hypothetical protein VN381_07900, partial [Anaerovoracaceae bacterium]|nr:hypothetical protein [Anaerovoracaceae bacterium]
YQRVRIEKSMFFKLRDTERISIAKAAEMLALRNDKKEDDGGADLNERPGSVAQGKEKPVYYMPFQKEDFCRTASASGQWTPDFVDSLMLFYQYNEMVIQYKRITGRAKDCKQKQEANHAKHD